MFVRFGTSNTFVGRETKMNGKAHSLEMLSMMIDTAEKYVHDPDLRKGIIRKCHQEIGLNVIDAPPHQRAGIILSHHESVAMQDALLNRRLEREGPKNKSL